MFGAPISVRIWRACHMSSPLRTKLSATMSTPSCAPNFRSSMSFGVSASADSCTPGALMPLCSSSVPPSITFATISRPSARSISQLNLAVVEQQLPARARLAHELGIRRVDVLVVALAVAGDDANGLPVLQLDRPCRPSGGRCGSSARSNPGGSTRLSSREPRPRESDGTFRREPPECREKN